MRDQTNLWTCTMHLYTNTLSEHATGREMLVIRHNTGLFYIIPSFLLVVLLFCCSVFITLVNPTSLYLFSYYERYGKLCKITKAELSKRHAAIGVPDLLYSSYYRMTTILVQTSTLIQTLTLHSEFKFRTYIPNSNFEPTFWIQTFNHTFHLTIPTSVFPPCCS